MRIEGTSALVTGAAAGLGLATAEALHAAGVNVIGLDLNPGGEERFQELGENAAYVAGDVTAESAVNEAIDVSRERFGEAPRIAVSCAGIATPGKILGRKSVNLEAFNRVIQVNLIGAFNVTRINAAAMAELEPLDDERGVIIHTASIAAFEGQIGQCAYSASKGAIASLVLPAARELAAHSIRVAAIAPGVFDTPMLQGLGQEIRYGLGAAVPHPSRLGKPSEYADLVLSIVRNPMLNGNTVRLDGALRLS